ncbi:MAG TPA: VWA domain-containing protein [Vicinamibacterales bacterium]|nr:VWA domain-containing protein [Vicinamibacterales bacterium]
MAPLPTYLACAALALFATVSAQPLFRSAVDLVTVPVTVTAKDTLRRVGELGIADFRLYEDGVQQDLSVVSHEPRALSVCILLDSSPSMASGRQPLATRAIDTLLEGLEDDDEASVHFFAATSRTVLPWTRGADMTVISWLEWRLSLGTALIDALKEGLAQVEKASNPLPVIVVVSDGGENVSGTSLSKLVETRRQSETLIYGVHTDLAPSRYAPLVNRAFANFLPQVVGDSGGMIHRVRTTAEAETAAEALLEELRSQYTLGFSPKRALDGKYRTLKVEAVDQNLATRHRAGYLATAP